MKRLLCFFIAIAALLIGPGICQQHIAEVIDTPTATAIDLGSYSFSTRLYSEGSILTRLYYGIIMEGLTLGLSFDAENVIGSKEVNVNRPFLFIKFPLYTGDQKWPVVSVGFDEQGLGDYDEEEKLYKTAPMGFFIVLTKLGLAPGLNFSMGANANHSLLRNAPEKILGFCSSDYMISPEFMLLAEVKEITAWNSYLNVGAKYFMNQELNFEFSALNIGGRNGDWPERIIKVTYTKVWGMF
jgi:hypothetical protein